MFPRPRCRGQTPPRLGVHHRRLVHLKLEIKMACKQHLETRCVFAIFIGSQHLRCRGSQPTNARLESCIEKFNSRCGVHHRIAGGSAGFCYWLSCYPIDVIKNKIQTSKGGARIITIKITMVCVIWRCPCMLIMPTMPTMRCLCAVTSRQREYAARHAPHIPRRGHVRSTFWHMLPHLLHCVKWTPIYLSRALSVSL